MKVTALPVPTSTSAQQAKTTAMTMLTAQIIKDLLRVLVKRDMKVTALPVRTSTSAQQTKTTATTTLTAQIPKDHLHVLV
jgi:hypothetical protein